MAKNEENELAKLKARLAKINQNKADEFFKKAVTEERVKPYQRDVIKTTYLDLLELDEEKPLEGKNSRAESYRNAIMSSPQGNLTKEMIPAMIERGEPLYIVPLDGEKSKQKKTSEETEEDRQRPAVKNAKHVVSSTQRETFFALELILRHLMFTGENRARAELMSFLSGFSRESFIRSFSECESWDNKTSALKRVYEAFSAAGLKHKKISDELKSKTANTSE